MNNMTTSTRNSHVRSLIFQSLFWAIIFLLSASSSVRAQWCNSPACTGGTNFNNIDNAGVLTPTTSRQVTNKYTGGSCGGGTEHKIYYSFAATAGRTYVFDLGGMGIDGLTDNDLRIYNGVCASGTQVAGGTTPTCDNNGYVEWTCTSSGTYYVVPQYGCGNFSECMNVRMGYYYLDLVPGCTAAAFFDNGGSGGSGTSRGGVGSNNGNYFQGTTGWARTYMPSNPANKTNVTFSSFATEAGVDLLYVYDGNSTGAPQVAGSPFSGSALPGGASGITSTAADGSLTFRFVSDGGLPVNFVVGAGWNASISAGAPTVNAGADKTICNGQNATLNGTSSGTYSWSPAGTLSCSTCQSPVASPNVPTTYTLSSTNGCGTVTDLVTVLVNDVPAISAGSDKSVCPGGSTTLNGSGGGTYSWSPSAALSCSTCSGPVASPTGVTTYTVTSSNGCGSATDEVTVNINSPPTANAVASSSTLCSGQSVTLTGSGGGTYSWSPSAGLSCTTCANPVASPTALVTYTLTVTDANGCTDTDPAILDVTALPNANVGASSSVVCTGQSATLTASGGGTYSWNTGGTTATVIVTPTNNTTYTVTVTNSSGCSKTATASVNITAAPTAAISGVGTVCSGSPVTLTATGGGTYSWNTGSTSASIVVSQTAATSYTVVVSAGSCTDTATTTLAMYTMPTAAISTASTNICTGQTATLTASGGGTYAWNTGSTNAVITVSPTVQTSYTVTVTNSDGCTDTDVITLNSASTPVAAIAGNSTICAGQTASLSASGGGTYTWSTGATTASISVSPVTPTTYSVIVAIGSCTASATSNVTVNPVPNASISASGTTLCSGQTATLNASGGGTYSWNTGSTANSISVSPTANTSYTVTVTNSSGCTATAVTSLGITNAAFAAVTSASTICSGNAAVLTASGGGTYVWSPGGQTSPSIIVSPTANTNYSVIVSNGGCTDTASTTVSVDPSPTANAGVNVTVVNGNSTTLGATGGGTYLWSTGETTQTISVPAVTTTYTVIVTNAYGCTDAAVVTVYSKYECPEIFVPSAFSPNGDNHNDEFYVRSMCLKTMHLMIFDRWGRQVFSTDDITDGWNGWYNGQIGDQAVFCYIVKYEFINGETGEKKGTVSLIR